MKRVIFIILFVVPSLFLNGQNNNIKSRQKKPAGTTDPGFSLKMINSINGNKSVSSNKFAISRDLLLPGISIDDKDISKIIRKNGVPVYIEKKTNPKKSEGNLTIEERFYSFLLESRAISGVR